MTTFLKTLLLCAAGLSAADALVRLVLLAQSRRRRDDAPGAPLQKPLVVIPARDEGEHVHATVASARATNATVALLLDGADPIAESIGRELGAHVLRKEPSGPTKGAALAWLAREHRELVLASDAVMILDVGSTLDRDFFERLRWPEGSLAVQAFIAGGGEGVGSAVSSSERFAQRHEDLGRQALGWSARLRGTGTAFRPEVFLDLIPRLRTKIEDTEASLLLAAAGGRVRMVDAIVRDEKPGTVYSAASQRARWILARYHLLVRHFGVMLRAAASRPLEMAAWLIEIFGRPISLTALVRAAATAVLIRDGRPWLACAVAATVALDAAMFMIATPAAPRVVMRLMASWLLAIALVPRALFQWTRSRRA